MSRRYRVGIIGGGQLARMMQQAAIGLGIETHLLSEGPDTSAAQVVPITEVGDYTDLETLAGFAESCDVITFDHEHVPTRHLRALESQIAVRPGPDALECAQDKARMRERLSSLGVPCPQFAICRSTKELLEFGEKQGWPIIAKTSRGGYDGKGVWKLDGPDAAVIPFESKPAVSAGEEVVILAEEFIDFERELSVIAVRSACQAVVYPVSETTQRNGVCIETITPAPGLSQADATTLQELALRIAGELGVVGVLAVELMQSRDGRVVVNELAMRPHNTGHWSIDGARTSQFANHIRAVLDLPLGSPEMTSPVAVMTNILGGSEDDLTEALRHVFARDREVAVHLYGKQVRPGRKVGHVTACDTSLSAALRRSRHAAGYLMGEIDE
ncbi:5-(carboxyamino)imidazole ribonucleotide synthase [Arachnia rubra]|uniref:N5-carboxyaminoimidazole ribonucleotide synthase n=1 Tax=Arachnia rubra TaxID=1547448 RepID=A0ABX7Y376_9ACTN|nr:5-(carboxyamino)imidazole ribonucleotide synthase [Arachnia rubra]QUC07320.1 5-(carboxyamino)imidazole ribonucleotide synthase [Arachnia rubra]BCR81590.1 N5-carboxyaminoimidazole ribonucleotide synthase [Arachnia rubra]